ncbi:MAG: hypothetical protein RLZZ09_1366 [Pseudomonadota bacterium]
MAGPPIPSAWLLELGHWFERSRARVHDLDGQPLQGLPGWAFLPHSRIPAEVIAGWVQRVGYAGSYPVLRDDECVPVELEEDEASGQLRYRCPDSFRWRRLPAQAAAVYTVDSGQFLGALADLLDLPLALRPDPQRPALADRLWLLGRPRIGPTQVPVWYACGLRTGAVAIFEYLAQPSCPDQGLILHGGLPLPDLLRPPRQYRFVSLQQALVDGSNPAQLDHARVYRMLTAAAGVVTERSLPVAYDPHLRQLTIRTIAKPWLIKGEAQAAAVHYLFKQAQQDRWLLKAEEILKAVHPGRTVGRSARLQSLFRGNDEWTDYIANPRRGYYGFRVA